VSQVEEFYLGTVDCELQQPISSLINACLILSLTMEMLTSAANSTPAFVCTGSAFLNGMWWWWRRGRGKEGRGGEEGAEVLWR
jgi:hypothetical protein